MFSRLKSPYKDIAEIAVAFVAAWVLYQVLTLVTGTPLPIVSVVSDSMEPILHRGDLLVVLNADSLRVGDVVIYQRSDTKFTIVHRVIGITDSGYVTKGDNNPGPDPGVVKKEQIMGKVAFALPLLGYPRLALYAVGI